MRRSKGDSKTCKFGNKFRNIFFLLLICAISISCNDVNVKSHEAPLTEPQSSTLNKIPIPANTWQAPDSNTIPKNKTGDMIRYGKELLAHTAKYFGPKGSVAQLSNGMNCQNCHLEGGSRLFANNYSGVLANYPKMSYRSGKIQPLSGRIADCFNRSMAGKVPDTNGREVRAMMAYINWIGQGVKKSQKLFGSATERLAFLEAPADPEKGKAVFVSKCKVCHGANGEGIISADKRTYTYPPLWGDHSYNNGAGMYRISNLAGFC